MPQPTLRDPNRVYICEDVTLNKGIVLQPGQTSIVRAHFGKGSYLENLMPEEEERVRLSGRSRLAQVGVVPSRLATQIAVEAYQDAREKGLSEFDSIMVLENLSEAEVELRENDRVFREYLLPSEPIKNGELIDLVNSGYIQMDGRKGSGGEGTDEYGDWDYYHENDGVDKTDIAGIAYRIQKNGRAFIARTNNPIHIPTGAANYRELVQAHWVDIKYRANQYRPGLWFGKTIPTNFDYPVVAEIDPKAYPHMKANMPHGHSWEHIESRLLGSDDNWGIVVELFSPTEGDHVADWVVFKFYRQ